MTPHYRLTGIAKYYGDKLALELESLTILPGRIYVLTGDNGSGKSTLLSILAFLSKPERGEIEFDGIRVEWKNAELQILAQEGDAASPIPISVYRHRIRKYRVWIEAQGPEG